MTNKQLSYLIDRIIPRSGVHLKIVGLTMQNLVFVGIKYKLPVHKTDSPFVKGFVHEDGEVVPFEKHSKCSFILYADEQDNSL